jgi:ATP/ADP translocase
MSKQQYLAAIRANSAYPVYRGVINIITLLSYLMAAVIALGAIIGAAGAMSYSMTSGLGVLVTGVIFAALYFFLGRFFKEAALILADIGDSVVDANSQIHPRAPENWPSQS